MNKIIKAFIFLMIFSVRSSLQICAQSVSYTYKPLAAEGCSVKYNVIKQDTTCYIVATVSSDRMKFLSEPTMKIKTFKGSVLTFSGKVIDNSSSSFGILSGSMMIPITGISSTAQFKVIPSEFEMLREGVAKIRLSMTPMNHERVFKKDKIGQKLYQLYLKVKSKEEDF